MKTVGVVVFVFAIAVLMRLSSCYESFWIDELHTAWTVADEFADVAPRAALGNQMPVYFWGIWVWQQLVGNSEFALRLTSVLAVAAAAAWLCVVVRRESGSLIAGAMAGVVIAVEGNSLWFGTELRPYGLILLVSCVALGATFRLAKENAENAAHQRLVLMACLIAGVLLQPTSLGVLLWMPMFLTARSMWIRRSWWPRFGISVFVQIITLVAVILWAWQFTLQASWQIKDNWTAFAVPTWIGPYWEIWPWRTLVIVPILVGWAVRKGIGRAAETAISSKGRSDIAVTLGVAAMGITFLYWTVAYLEWIPLWHRRYFIAVLPMIASVPAFAFSGLPRFLTFAGGLAVLAVLMTLQSTWPSLEQLAKPHIVRHEAWREAIDWLDEQVGDNDRVYLDSGLVEARLLEERGGDPDLDNYLTFPVRGPYGTGILREDVRPVARSLLLPLSVLGSPSSSEDRIWIVSRRTMRAMKAALKRSIRRSGPFDYSAVRLISFGNVTIAEVPRLKEPKRRGWFGFGRP